MKNIKWKQQNKNEVQININKYSQLMKENLV